MTPGADLGRYPTRKRARQACLHCNRRRIRCNVLETRPCHNCVSMNVPCEVGVSKRGKYPRKKALRQSGTPHEEDSIISDSTVSADHSIFRPGDSSLVHIDASDSPDQRHRLGQRGSSATYSRNSLGTSWISPGDTTTVSQQTVFLGESSPLTCVIDEGRRSPEKGPANAMQNTRLHYPIPEKLDASSTRDEALRAHRRKVQAQLHADGAFSYPPKDTCAILLSAYFTWFHPCFPILDRLAAQQSYVRGDISHLLLQSMLFIGVSLCTDEDFARTEFSVRYRAKFLFYSRAKAIYDADWESNKTTKLQSLFLLSSWRGGPSEERDTRFWLGVAISLAQKRGMHMMLVSEHSRIVALLILLGPNYPSRLGGKKNYGNAYGGPFMWIRDQQSAAALGLPPRIRDEDCDVAMLEPSDIREDEAVDDADVFGAQRDEDIVYPAQMAKLARILRTIVSTQYLPVQSDTDESSRTKLQKTLCEWESCLPTALKLESAASPRAMFLTGLLHMTYNNLYILLHRSSFLNSSNPPVDEAGQVALDAATRSTRIIEDMLSHNLVQHGPTHLITHTFSTLCIHTIHCRRTSGTAKKLAEHRAKLCLLGLQELQKTWDIENWVLNLFFRCLDDSTARTLRLTDIVAPPGQPVNQIETTEKNAHADQAQDLPTPTEAMDSIHNDPTLAPALQPSPSMENGDITASSEWYGLFNFTDDFTDVLGASSYHDSLNLQNLEFLYRFL
ncbi:Zn(II)2Cys6 transcription factor [Aspergillus bombycis]|uniref:Zn(II)2Cys6 transcription factor n=1 Tax=Aspergillus bombycis TaxID=109264 RepID=A0A1F8AGQ5_9EURO|nr:Zn(II)2Cys6 transcription factor [Aspergillus bombycis]OGM50589.1 Zn(II)2Cys6 transcription factor [Aspergillus bombycis]